MSRKGFYIGGASGLFVILLVVLAYIGYREVEYSVTHVPPPPAHTWSTYTNKKLGFAVEYPSDIAHPYEMSDPPSSDGVFPGAGEVRFAGRGRPLLSVWTQETRARNPDEWFLEAYGPDGKGWHIVGRSIVGGPHGYPAIILSEEPLPASVEDVGGNPIAIPVASSTPPSDTFTLTLVRSGKSWTLTFDRTRLSAFDIGYVMQSFRFLHWCERIAI